MSHQVVYREELSVIVEQPELHEAAILNLLHLIKP
jgi:hypothetical protein